MNRPNLRNVYDTEIWLLNYLQIKLSKLTFADPVTVMDLLVTQRSSFAKDHINRDEAIIDAYHLFLHFTAEISVHIIKVRFYQMHNKKMTPRNVVFCAGHN